MSKSNTQVSSRTEGDECADETKALLDQASNRQRFRKGSRQHSGNERMPVGQLTPLVRYDDTLLNRDRWSRRWKKPNGLWIRCQQVAPRDFDW